MSTDKSDPAWLIAVDDQLSALLRDAQQLAADAMHDHAAGRDWEATAMKLNEFIDALDKDTTCALLVRAVTALARRQIEQNPGR